VITTIRLLLSRSVAAPWVWNGLPIAMCLLPRTLSDTFNQSINQSFNIRLFGGMISQLTEVQLGLTLQA